MTPFKKNIIFCLDSQLNTLDETIGHYIAQQLYNWESFLKLRKGKNVKNTAKETAVSFFDAIKYTEINNIVYYSVDVPEIAAVYYFSINPVEKEVSYFVTNDFTKPVKKIGFKNGEQTAFEIVGDIPGIHSKVAALLFLKAAYHLLKKKIIPETISYCR